jgi:hypothetical protein
VYIIIIKINKKLSIAEEAIYIAVSGVVVLLLIIRVVYAIRACMALKKLEAANKELEEAK